MIQCKKICGGFEMFKKIFAAGLLAITLIFVGGQNNSAEARDPVWEVVGIRTYLSIREYPTVNSRELARVPNGTFLGAAGDITNGFAYVYYEGIYGWASITYLR